MRGTLVDGVPRHIFTIGVYGKTESVFLGQLVDAEIDAFCDIRARRGVRGTQYKFVNSIRLQTLLASLQIAYYRFQDLAPTKAARSAQELQDKATGIKKRSRLALSSEFQELYRQERLSKFCSHEFINRFAPTAKRIVLFCVEADAMACHRSLIAERLSEDLGITITHL